MKRDKHIYIGLDLHKFQHTAVILDCWNEKLGEMTFPNKPSIFPSLLEYVNRYLKESLTPVFGLEDVGGYGRDLAMYLIEQGYIVKFVNSSLSNAERNSHAMTQKHDSWDAQCVARVLIRDLPYLPEATPSDIHWIIAQLVGRRNAIVKAQTALKNQLHMQLNYHYPSYKDFFSEVDGKTALSFWESYPSPSHMEGATVEDLRTFLLKASNNACSTRKAEHILSLVHTDGEVKREYQTSRDFIIQSIVRDIRFKKQEIKKVDKELKVTIQTLGMQLETMPGIDTLKKLSKSVTIPVLRILNVCKKDTHLLPLSLNNMVDKKVISYIIKRQYSVEGEYMILITYKLYLLDFIKIYLIKVTILGDEYNLKEV